MLNLKISENVRKKAKTLSDVICVLILQNLFVEQMEETTRTHVCALAEEIVKNTVMENVLRKRAVPDVQEYFSLFAVKRESLMTICVT